MKTRIPKYCRHKGSGQAYVNLDGTRHYLGAHGSEESIERYNRIVAELVASPATKPKRSIQASSDGITVAELVAAYWHHAEGYYQKDGSPTVQLLLVKLALRPVRELYGRAPVAEFGPLALKAVRQKMVEEGLCRPEVNRRVRLIKQAFRWGVAEELIPPGIYEALRAVDGLRRGRTEAPDHAPVEPVPDEVVDATLPHLPEVVADMVRLQRLTGARPGEICDLRPADLDRSDPEVWTYRPARHKTEHHGSKRLICFGPRAQEVITPYLLRPDDEHCFSPRESERRRLEALHAKRKTPLSCGNRPGSNRRSKPKRLPRDRYDNKSYRRVIRRTIERINKQRIREAEENDEEPILLPDWSPNRLRHTAATAIRRTFGLEGAGSILGHARLDTTEIYAERNMELARTIALKIG